MGSAEVYLSVKTKRNSKELLSKNPVKFENYFNYFKEHFELAYAPLFLHDPKSLG